MIGVSRLNASQSKTDGIRPVNLQTDLAPLADLLEVVFADSMDSGGRAALREMRYLSKMGPGTRILARVNDLAMGINMGYVWIDDGKLIGNVSVYPSDWPREVGKAFIIANVGTHPDYQNHGIAYKLMQASMGMIYQRGADFAILQVDINNNAARHLYKKLGFVEERAFTQWRRSGFSRNVPILENDIFIRRRRHSEWQDEMALAEMTRPQLHGGLGWLRPLHPRYFRRPFYKVILDWINLRNREYLVVHDSASDNLAASLWVENSFAGRTQMTLLNDPDTHDSIIETLLNNAVRRYSRSGLTIEHPGDDTRINNLLRRYQFTPQRTVMHMRWDVRPLA